MDDSASVVASALATFDHRCPPESCESLNHQSEAAPPKAALELAASPAHAEETKASRFICAGEGPADVTHEKQLHHRSSGARSRKGRRGGGRGTLHRYASRIDREVRGSDVQHGQLRFIQFVGPQLIEPEVTPKMKLLTTGAEALIVEPATVEVSMLPQFLRLPLAWCDICRADCNSVEVLERHRNGKRHKRIVQLLKQMQGQHEIVEEPLAAAHLEAEQNVKCVDVTNEDMIAKGAIKIATRTEAMDGNFVAVTSQKRKRAKHSEPEQPRVCILCSATCNSQAMFESHLAGKKHTSRIRRFQGPDTVYGLLCDYVPPNHSSTLASQGTKPLYYGLKDSEHSPPYAAALNPLLEQEQKHEEQELAIGFPSVSAVLSGDGEGMGKEADAALQIFNKQSA